MMGFFQRRKIGELIQEAVLTHPNFSGAIFGHKLDIGWPLAFVLHKFMALKLSVAWRREKKRTAKKTQQRD
jgi:hypothetical protein